MKLPPKLRRSTRGALRSTKNGREEEGVYHPKRILSLPGLFVGIKEKGFGGIRYVAAQIKLRRHCYRYLVWREGGRKREMYLGKVKILASVRRSADAGLAGVDGIRSSRDRGGKK